MGKILAAISVIKELIALIKLLLAWLEQREIKKSEEKSDKAVEGIDQATKAKTPEEAWNAQESIVNNKP